MPKIRTIKPEFWTSEDVVRCGPLARLFFIGLWTFCDDAGVFKWAPLTLKMQIFPNDPVDPAPLLEELLAAGLVAKIEHGGQTYGHIVNFSRHQKVDARYFKAILPQFKPVKESAPDCLAEDPPHPAERRRDDDEATGDHVGARGGTRGPDTGGGSGGVGGGGEVGGIESLPVSSGAKSKKPSSPRKGPRPSVERIMSVMRECFGELDDSDTKNRRYSWLLVQRAMKGSPAAGEDRAAEACESLIRGAAGHDFWGAKITKVETLFRNAHRIANDLRELQGRALHL